MFQDEQELDPASLRKIHKKNIKYAEQAIMQARIDVQAAINKSRDSKDSEQLLRLKDQVRKLVAFEQLFLSLCLLIMIPSKGDQKAVIETLEDIEELKECF